MPINHHPSPAAEPGPFSRIALDVDRYLAPVYAVIDRQAAAGDLDPAPVTITLSDTSTAVLTRNMVLFPRAEHAVTGKSMRRCLLGQARDTRLRTLVHTRWRFEKAVSAEALYGEPLAPEQPSTEEP